MGLFIVRSSICLMSCGPIPIAGSTKLKPFFRGGLQRADAWLTKMGRSYRYCGALCKWANTWRYHMKHVFLVWAVLFGLPTALAQAKTYICRCIAGRWGSVSNFERRAMLCGRKESCVVFRAVLARKANDSEDDTEPHEYAEVQAAAGLAAWEQPSAS